MKTIFSALCFILIGLLHSNAQSGPQKIEITKGFPKYAFRYGDLSLDMQEIAVIVKKNKLAYKLLKPARLNHSLSTLCIAIGVGGAMAPLQLLIPPIPESPRADRSGRYVLPFVGIGLGALAISIPLQIKAEKQAAKAVELYNSGLGSNRFKQKQSELRFVSTYSGAGLSFTF